MSDFAERDRRVTLERGVSAGARTVVARTVIEGCMVGSCREHILFQGLPWEINLYLEVALSGNALKLYCQSVLLTEQDLKSISSVCMHMY